MAPPSSLTLPAEFYDRVSERMLVQPLPQYLYASLLFAGNAQAQMRRTGFGSANQNPARMPDPNVGAGVLDLEAMQLLIADNIRGGAITVADELGEGVGMSVRLNRPQFDTGGLTLGARQIASGQSISTSGISVAAQQVSLTIARYAGPYASNGTAVQPYEIDRLAATRSVHSLVQLVGLNLQKDRYNWVDSVIGSFYDDGDTTLYPGDTTDSITSDSSAFVANVNGDRPMDLETIYRVEASLTSANIPRFGNGKYIMIVTPQQARQIKSNSQFISTSQYFESKNPLFQSFVGLVGGMEIYQSTTNVIDTTTVSGVSINHATAFGPGAIGYGGSREGVRVAAANDDNYGETARVIWLAYEAFGMLDNRFIVNVHSN